MPVTVKNTRYRNICCASSINTILNYGKPWPDVLTYIMTSLLLPNNWNRDGKAVIIRPTVPLKIGRLDQKPQQLLKLHDHGIECGLAKFHEIMQLYRK